MPACASRTGGTYTTDPRTIDPRSGNRERPGVSLATPSAPRAIALKLTAVTSFVVMASCIKAASADVPAGEAAFFRSAFAMPLIAGWLAWNGRLRDGLRTANPLGHFWRGVIGTTAMLMGFAALGLLPLPQVTAIGYAVPVITVVLAAVFLGERIRLVRISAVALGLVGVGIVLWPDLVGAAGDARALGVALALGSAALAATAQIFIRRLVVVEDAPTIAFWFSVSATVIALATWPLGLFGAWVVPSGVQWTLLTAAGVLGGVGQLCLTAAYRFGEASLIAPFDYASMLLAIGIGLVVFGEVPRASTLVGAAVVIAAGAIIIWREARLGLERGAARKLTTPQG